MKKLALATILVLVGCTTATTVKEQSTILMYGIQHKVLMVVSAPCAQIQIDKPALVMEWVREKDINKMQVICDVNCNCKLVKRSK